MKKDLTIDLTEQQKKLLAYLTANYKRSYIAEEMGMTLNELKQELNILKDIFKIDNIENLPLEAMKKNCMTPDELLYECNRREKIIVNTKNNKFLINLLNKTYQDF